MSGGAGGSLEVGGIGSLKCYQYIGLTKKVEAIAYSSTKFSVEEQQQSHRELCLDIPGHLPWLVKDTENDPTAFTVEIATSGIETYGYFNAAGGDSTNGGIGGGNDEIAESKDEIDANTGTEKDEDENSNADHQSEERDFDDDGVFDCWGDSSQEDDVEGMEDLLGDDDDEKIDQVQLDLTRAANMNKEFVKYKFKCPSRDNEKALWIAAFKKVGRLSDESKRKKRLFRGGAAAVANLTTSNAQRNSRIRRTSHTIALGEQNVEKVEEKEYRVRPGYAYKHRWMTQTELADEMNALSSVIYDTRLSPAVAPSLELGLLKVEILQCLGLPRLKGKHPNTVVYLVCGSYAFTTDVITSCQNPMWLKGMRRACALPIYHGYAALMAGVFHDDGSKGAASKDTFIGRVEVPISHLRPNSTYDVTLPLRQSTSVYTRRQLGAIRIRFSLVSYNEKQSILSYLPRRRNKIAACRLVWGKRYGLIGRNGMGKSTMLRAFAARRVGDVPSNVSVHYVSQEVKLTEEERNKTPIELVVDADIERKLLCGELAVLEGMAADGTLDEKGTIRHAEVLTHLSDIGSDDAPRRAENLLTNLGFSEELRNRPLAELSGGWRVRTMLAAAIFAKPDMCK